MAADNGAPVLTIMQSQLRDICPNSAPDTDSLEEAFHLLGHTKQGTTKRVCSPIGRVVNP